MKERVSFYMIVSCHLVVMALCSCSFVQQGAVDACIVVSANTAAYTDPCGCCGGQKGGLPARASYLVDKVESATGDAYVDFLLLDCGSFSNNDTETTFIQSRYTARSYGMMGYDAVNIGKNEISMPQERLGQILAEFGRSADTTEVPVVSANLDVTFPEGSTIIDGRINIDEYARVRLEDGQRVFITGVVGMTCLRHGLADELGYRIMNPAERVARVVSIAKRNELVIVLTNGLSEEEVEDLLEIDRIDVIAGVEPQMVPEEYRKTGEPLDKILLPEGEDRGRVIGRCEFTRDGADSLTINEIAMDPLPKGMGKHPMIVSLLEEMSAEVTEYHRGLHQEMMNRDLDTVVDYVGRTACAECHNEIYQEYMKSKHAFAVTSLVDIGESRNGLCLPCHTTGFGEVTGFSMVSRTDNLDSVGCEQCHGPGEVHIQIMNGAKLTGPTRGLNGFGVRPVTEDVCRRCHMENTDPDFDFSTRIDAIQHPEEMITPDDTQV